MYGIAITVSACLRSGTRADIAWLVSTEGVDITDSTEAVVFTPGGGKVGSLLGGAVDGKLADLAGRGELGRLVTLQITEVDAEIAGLPEPGMVQCLLVPATQIPPEVWSKAADRDAFTLISELEGDTVTAIRIDDAVDATPDTVTNERVISVFHAISTMAIVGDAPVAAALLDLASLLGWHAQHVTRSAAVSALATLSSIDMVVIAAHDIELAGAALLTALESKAGYIGSVGSRRMQENRADWLAYRGVTDLSRVHGPAGLDIGAESPGEIAVAIAAEAIAEVSQHGGGGDGGVES